MTECRLCSCRTDLVNIFDPNLKNSRELRCFILLATAVEIKETDIVSKFVCRRCCILAIKIYKFRTKAIANDKALKEQCGQHYTPPPSPPFSSSNATQNNANTSANKECESATTSTASASKSPVAGPSRVKRRLKRHSSVENVLRKFPKVKLPPSVLKSHIDPVISLDKDAVKNWLDAHTNSKEEVGSLEDITKKLIHITVRRVVSAGLSNNDKVYEIVRPNETPKTHNPSSAVLVRKGKLPVKSNVARKKTSTSARSSKKKKKIVSEDGSSDEYEYIPAPKRRSLVAPTVGPQKIDLPNEKPASKEVQKEIFTSSLELAPAHQNASSNESSTESGVVPGKPSDKNILCTVREVNLFICNVCNKICDTKKELADHQKRHLQCTFCKTKVKNIDALMEHLNETCFINLTKNLPSIVLTRVDEDPEMKERFGDSFRTLEDAECKMEDWDSDSNDNTDLFTHQIEEVDVPMDSSDFIDETNEASALQPQRDSVKSPNNNFETPELQRDPIEISEGLYETSVPEPQKDSIEISEGESSVPEPQKDSIEISEGETSVTEPQKDSIEFKENSTLESQKDSCEPLKNIYESHTLLMSLLKDTSYIKKTETPLDKSITNKIKKAEEKYRKIKSKLPEESPSSEKRSEINSIPTDVSPAIKCNEINNKTPEVSSAKKCSKSKNKPPEVPSKENVVCISDESDNENVTNKGNKAKTIAPEKSKDIPEDVPMESVSIIRPEIKLVQNNVLTDVYVTNFQNMGKMEEDVIKALFGKHCVNVKKTASVQMFLPEDSSIKKSVNRLMCIEGMFNELLVHTVPVDLQYNDKIKIGFQKLPDKKIREPDFSWQNKPVIDIKPKTSSLFEDVIQIDDEEVPQIVPVTTALNQVAPILLNGSNYVLNSTLPPLVPLSSNSSPAILIPSNNVTQTTSTTKDLVCVPQVISGVSSASFNGVSSANFTPTVFTSQLLQPQVHQSSNSGNAVLVNQVASQDGLVATQKLMTMNHQSQAPTILNAHINNYNKILVVAPNSNLTPDMSYLKGSTGSALANSSFSCQEVQGTESNAQGSSSTQFSGTGQSLLRVKNLWEINSSNLQK